MSNMSISKVKIPMQDGVELFALVFKPVEAGKYPVILSRTPYTPPYNTEMEVTPENYLTVEPTIGALFGGHLTSVTTVSEVVDRGYCVIEAHTRGTGNSGGAPFNAEHSLYDYDDGVDTLNWIRKQNFYNGEIFLSGLSYSGSTALASTVTTEKDIKGVIAFEPSYWHHELAQRNGFFKIGMLGTWAGMVLATSTNEGPQKTNFNDDVFRTFPQKDWGDVAFGRPIPLYLDSQTHPDENDPWWKSDAARGHKMYEALENLDVPTLFIEGWFDLFIDPAVKMWNEVIPEATRKKSAMLVCPFSHGSTEGSTQGSLEMMTYWPFDMKGAGQSEAYPDYFLNWCDHVRKGTPLKLIKEGEITFFPEAGQKKWYYEEKFTEGGETHVLHLNEGGKLEPTAGQTSEVTYLYNPYNPASFTGGTCRTTPYMQCMPLLPQDAPNSRYDIISFLGKPFEKPFTIKGSMGADVYVKSDCEDTCFYVRLCLIRDGVTYGIRDDITSLSYQLGDYTPGQEVKLHFDFPHLAWEVQAGDAFRIDISSSAFPIFSPHTNVKGLQAFVEKPKYAHNTVVFGKSTFTYRTADLSKLESAEV